MPTNDVNVVRIADSRHLDMLELIKEKFGFNYDCMVLAVHTLPDLWYEYKQGPHRTVEEQREHRNAAERAHYQKAEEMRAHILELRKETPNMIPEDETTAIISLALISFTRGRFKKAKYLSQAVLERQRAILGPST